jgi:hypothetical protein
MQPSHPAGNTADAAVWHAFARQRGSAKQEPKPRGGKGEDGKQEGKKEEEEGDGDEEEDEEDDEDVHEHFPLMVRF